MFPAYCNYPTHPLKRVGFFSKGKVQTALVMLAKYLYSMNVLTLLESGKTQP